MEAFLIRKVIVVVKIKSYKENGISDWKQGLCFGLTFIKVQDSIDTSFSAYPLGFSGISGEQRFGLTSTLRVVVVYGYTSAPDRTPKGSETYLASQF